MPNSERRCGRSPPPPLRSTRSTRPYRHARLTTLTAKGGARPGRMAAARPATPLSSKHCYHLKVRPVAAPEYRRRIFDLFRLRSWAVHADAKFRPAIERPDLDRAVDWHYVAFRADNAVNAAGGTIQMLSALVDVFGRGSQELREWQPHAREALDAVIARYDAEVRLPRLQWRDGGASAAE